MKYGEPLQVVGDIDPEIVACDGSYVTNQVLSNEAKANTSAID